MPSKILKLTSKQARASFAEIVARAKAGEATLVTFHDRLLAVVVPAKTVAELVAGNGQEAFIERMRNALNEEEGE
jgi:antitoxin (DNA-binding transcriptional repressor) of toxin-antitoxin stability system